jgi:lysophospholipid acyltransferase (LPLAT)-like uncharacterized protein
VWYKLSLIIVPRVFVWLTRIWFATCRIEVRGKDNLDAAVATGQGIACFYHYSILLIFYQLRHFRAATMVSASKDGEYIARVCELMGHVPVRGSRNRGGMRALKDMLALMAEGHHAGIVADGSQGPVFKVQDGVLMMAAKSGAPILPMAWSASRYTTFGSWDRTALPMPFSKIVIQYGRLYRVNEKKLTTDLLARHRAALQQEMDRTYHTAWDAFRLRFHHPSFSEKPLAQEKESQ